MIHCGEPSPDRPRTTWQAAKRVNIAPPVSEGRTIDLFVGDSTLIWYLAGMHEGDGLSVVPIPLSEER